MDRRSFLMAVLGPAGAGVALALLPMEAVQARRPTDLRRIHGKIKYVESFPDYTVQVVDSFPDLKVQIVENFPDAPGKWQIVTSFPDFKIKIVESFGDFKIKFVTSFPGVP